MADTCEIFDKRVYDTYPFIVLQKDIYNCVLGNELKILVHHILLPLIELKLL